MKDLQAKCPHCKKNFSYYESSYRPFCCERCKMVDLGHWLKGDYAIPVAEKEEKELDEEE